MRPIDPTLILLTPGETARRLSISLRVLKSRVDANQFPPPRRIGRSIRFLASEVEAYARNLPVTEIDWRGLSKSGDDWSERRTAARELNRRDFSDEISDTQSQKLGLLHKVWVKDEPERDIHAHRMDPNDPARLP